MYIVHQGCPMTSFVLRFISRVNNIIAFDIFSAAMLAKCSWTCMILCLCVSKNHVCHCTAHCILRFVICVCTGRYMWTDVSVFQYLMFESFNKTCFSMIDRSICSYVKYSKTSLLFKFLKLLLCDVPIWKKFWRQLN